ncbi:MAG: thioredoxin fold domain-containing protein, partial [Acidobacteria bacterium]|nr:thioredoxin fold domain-containing protein [Acidobacteriota bacterium]
MGIRKIVILAVGAGSLVAGLFGCAGRPDPWFDSGLEEAFAEAGERGTLVMVDFKTDWCTWCKRLDRDTFSDPAVVAELGEVVALQLDAEKEGVDSAERYGVRSYPTILFLDSAGNEVDRILGYLPPDAFLAEVQRIRAGDTFNACLARLNEDPANLEALERAVEGLLERSDAIAAIVRVEDFHATHPEDGSAHDHCRNLMFTARRTMNESLYRSAARLFRRDWPEVPEVADSLGVAHLHAMMVDLDAVEDDRQALRS